MLLSALMRCSHITRLTSSLLPCHRQGQPLDRSALCPENIIAYFGFDSLICAKYSVLKLTPFYILLKKYTVRLLSSCCPPVTKGHNWHIDYLSVILFSMGKWNVLTRFVLQAVDMIRKVHHTLNSRRMQSVTYV